MQSSSTIKATLPSWVQSLNKKTRWNIRAHSYTLQHKCAQAIACALQLTYYYIHTLCRANPATLFCDFIHRHQLHFLMRGELTLTPPPPGIQIYSTLASISSAPCRTILRRGRFLFQIVSQAPEAEDQKSHKSNSCNRPPFHSNCTSELDLDRT